MKSTRKGIFIMSLNSKRLKDAIDNKHSFHFSSDIEELDVFVFDTLEILNGIFFDEINVSQEQNLIEEIIGKLETDFIAINTNKRELIRCSKIRKELNPYILTVYTEYYTNSEFERHCKNQVFQNLQPKLTRLSITNNRSKLIELLIPFLLTEIALFLSIFHGENYCKIYGLEKEMNIISSIKENKYPSFNKFLSREINYTNIQVEENA